MRFPRYLLLTLTLPLTGVAPAPRQELPRAAPNDNRTPAGALRDGILTVALEAKRTMWHPDGDTLPGLATEAFAEAGKQPTAPGPLLRVAAGTEIQASVRNSLERDSITFHVPANVSRAGTFIYHSHVDEPRQHRAGLAGALVVRDPAPVDTVEDHVFFIKSARAGSQAPAPLEINGKENPDTTVLRVGRRYRLRFIGLQVTNPNASVTLTARPDSSFANLRDTLLVQWRPVAKDGADLPEHDRRTRPARQVVSMGETYDFEFQPNRRGELRIEVRAAVPQPRLFVRVPVRVE